MAKTELQEAGEDTEGMADSTAKMRKDILGLTGVDIMKSETEFRGTYDILKSISEVWKDMDDIDKAALLEKIQGKTRAEFAHMHSNMYNITVLKPVKPKALSLQCG